ncbi:MAG: DUF4189 domain-containing protein [Hydrogenophaga sp.]|uniref:DUF4189 domain-containing protein n=1 Tax=Hydrogenophaga sp. TaxID=1904254 RepID=UPI001A4D02B5|nr:DUF4189 domain-containing protein [Hydrogenophaga sp.]
MNRFLATLGTAVAAASTLVACGGGDGYTPYGAIAWDGGRPSAAVVANYRSQDTANTAAIERCGGGGCIIIFEFSGKGTCGALAVGGGLNLVTGVATGPTAAEAEAAAVSSCTAKGGGNCAVPSSLPAKCM